MAEKRLRKTAAEGLSLLGRHASASFRPFLEFLFPPLCYACARGLRATGALLCPSCNRQVEWLAVDHPLLDRARLVLSPAGVSFVFAMLSFRSQGPAQELMHQLKYGGMSVLGEALGRDAGTALRATFPLLPLDAVVPVPLHPARRRERGFNQSLLIARGVASMLSVPVCDFLVRVRNTRSQTGLGAAGRIANTRDAFAVDTCHAPPPGRSLLLVDDVLTTGATLAACASALASFRPTFLGVCTVAAAGRDSVNRAQSARRTGAPEEQNPHSG